MESEKWRDGATTIRNYSTCHISTSITLTRHDFIKFIQFENWSYPYAGPSRPSSLSAA